MRLAAFFLISVVASGIATADHHRTPEEEDARWKRFLTSDWIELDYIATLKIVGVTKGEPDLGFVTYRVSCEVIETFKGELLKTIEYSDTWEHPSIGPELNSTLITSLTYSKERGTYSSPENRGLYRPNDSLLKFLREKRERSTDQEEKNVSE